MQVILAEAAKVSGVTFSLEDAAGSWLGGEEYSFRVKVEAKSQEDYDKAVQALSYVAEAARQDAFIENQGTVERSQVTQQSLLSEDHTPVEFIPFGQTPTQQEIAQIQEAFNSKSTDELPLDATVTAEGITFAMPVWVLDRNHQWDRSSDNSYEVSSQGDKRFSALVATFQDGTIIEGTDVGGKTIEWIYQNIIKKSGKGKAPAKDSILYNPELKTKEEQEDYSYEKGYLPLWQKWAEQNPTLIEELRKVSEGKVLTDKFASTRVSQARALAEILGEESQAVQYQRYKELLSKWLNKIEEIYGEEQKATGRFSRLGRQPVQRTFQKIRFRSANDRSSQSEQTRNYSNFRDSYLSERRLSKESEGTLSEQEGQQVKQAVEQILSLSSSPYNTSQQPAQQQLADIPTQPAATSFVPFPLQMANLGIETGERMIPIDQKWKEQELLQLDAALRNQIYYLITLPNSCS